MLAEEIVLQTVTAAFSRRADGIITAWNGSAEELFALPTESAVGLRCFEVVCGRDVFGNDFCSELCSCWRMALDDRPIHPYRLTVRNSFGRPLDVRVSILAAKGHHGQELIHLMEPMVSRVLFAAFPEDLDGQISNGASGSDNLTRRELEVLRLLAVGWSTEDIAERLAISPTTVRNHISRCLQKLDVHSRLEAVTVARRLELV
jgi:DNA-binding CsgD family transcriptional regulator